MPSFEYTVILHYTSLHHKNASFTGTAHNLMLIMCYVKTRPLIGSFASKACAWSNDSSQKSMKEIDK